MKFLILALCVAISSAAVRRDAPAAAASPLDDLQKHAAEFHKVFTEGLNTLVNSKNTQEVQKSLKEGSDAVLKHLSAFSNSLQGALGDASGKAKEALESSSATLKRAVEELRSAHPDVEQQAGELKKKIETAVKSAVEETQKLAKAVADTTSETNKALEPKVRAAYDDFVKHAHEVQENLHKAANKQ